VLLIQMRAAFATGLLGVDAERSVIEEFLRL